MDIFLLIHILAAATWFGANVTQVLVTPRMDRAGGTTGAEWARATVMMGTRLYTPAAVLLLVTGIIVTLDRDYAFESVFIAIGVVMVVVGAVLGMRVFGPDGRKRADAFEAGDQAQVEAIGNKLRMFGTIDTVLLVVTIAAMVMGWGAKF